MLSMHQYQIEIQKYRRVMRKRKGIKLINYQEELMERHGKIVARDIMTNHQKMWCQCREKKGRRINDGDWHCIVCGCKIL